jgi:hypothetical protein
MNIYKIPPEWSVPYYFIELLRLWSQFRYAQGAYLPLGYMYSALPVWFQFVGYKEKYPLMFSVCWIQREVPTNVVKLNG